MIRDPAIRALLRYHGALLLHELAHRVASLADELVCETAEMVKRAGEERWPEAADLRSRWSDAPPIDHSRARIVRPKGGAS